VLAASAAAASSTLCSISASGGSTKDWRRLRLPPLWLRPCGTAAIAVSSPAKKPPGEVPASAIGLMAAVCAAVVACGDDGFCATAATSAVLSAAGEAWVLEVAVQFSCNAVCLFVLLLLLLLLVLVLLTVTALLRGTGVATTMLPPLLCSTPKTDRVAPEAGVLRAEALLLR
jgi:hypothetical protein